MMNIKTVIILFLFFITAGTLFCQTKKTPELINTFFSSLIAEEDIQHLVDAEALALSKRLNIRYENTVKKYLISYDIPEELKTEIRNGTEYDLDIEPLDDGFSKVLFTVPSKNFQQEFCFKNNRLTSSLLYETRNWETFNSKYFKVRTDNPAYFNSYALRKLDDFADAVISLLKISNERVKLLTEEKIIYFLCTDEDEIKRLTGFNTRGIYIIAYDVIVSIFPAHFHEISHLLMNFKLQTLPLYTLPLFQEGFPSAVGGRGGIARSVILELGKFLHLKDFISFDAILTKGEFFSEDASMTYPAAALYSYYLLNAYGIINYLELYLTYSGTADYINGLKPQDIKLPSVKEYDDFAAEFSEFPDVTININEDKKNDYYLFKVKSNLLLSPEEKLPNYISKKFSDIFPNIHYGGEKYLITAQKREINIYNLYTNTLIGSYSTGFSMSGEEVPQEDGYFVFYIKKDLFDEERDMLEKKEI